MSSIHRARRAGRAAACLALILSSLLLPGCIRRKDVGANGSKVTTISIAYWGSQNEVQVMEIFLTAFEKRNPGIRVKRIHIARDYGAKLQTMIASNRAPDVFYIGMQQSSQYMHKGVLVNLSPYLAKSKTLKKEEFFPETIRQFTTGDSTYALPKDWSPEVVFYNKDFFDQAHVPYPNEGWTWADFVKAAQKLTQRDERGHLLRYGAISYDWRHWVLQNGGRIYNDACDKCVLDSPEAIGGMQFLYDLTAKYGVAPAQTDAEVESAMYFMSGRTAMVFSYRWLINALAPLKLYHWAVGPVPRGKYPYNFSGVVGYAMSTQSRHPAASWRLMEYLTGTEGQTLVTKNHWGVPTLKRLADRVDLFEEPQHPNYNYKLFAHEVKLSRLMPGSPYVSDDRLDNIVGFGELGRMYLGVSTPAETMKTIARRVNEVIKANKAAEHSGARRQSDGK